MQSSLVPGGLVVFPDPVRGCHALSEAVCPHCSLAAGMELNTCKALEEPSLM